MVLSKPPWLNLKLHSMTMTPNGDSETQQPPKAQLFSGHEAGWHPHSPRPSRQHSGSEAGGRPARRRGWVDERLSPSPRFLPSSLPTWSSSSDEQGSFHCQWRLVRQPCHLDQEGFTDNAVCAHLTCPAEAEVIGDTRQPFCHPILLILLIYRRSKTEGPEVVYGRRWPTVRSPPERKHLSKYLVTAQFSDYILNHIKLCVCLISGMEWRINLIWIMKTICFHISLIKTSHRT